MNPNQPRRRRIMKEFHLKEISAVDRPAQAPARAMIMKRAGDAIDDAFAKVDAVLSGQSHGTTAEALTDAMLDYVQKMAEPGEETSSALLRLQGAGDGDLRRIWKAVDMLRRDERRGFDRQLKVDLEAELDRLLAANADPGETPAQVQRRLLIDPRSAAGKRIRDIAAKLREI